MACHCIHQSCFSMKCELVQLSSSISMTRYALLQPQMPLYLTRRTLHPVPWLSGGSCHPALQLVSCYTMMRCSSSWFLSWLKESNHVSIRRAYSRNLHANKSPRVIPQNTCGHTTCVKRMYCTTGCPQRFAVLADIIARTVAD